jgi:hypothetical protein
VHPGGDDRCRIVCRRRGWQATAGGDGQQPPAAAGLQGTAWRLVKFQGGDGTTLTPPDPARYCTKR